MTSFLKFLCTTLLCTILLGCENNDSPETAEIPTKLQKWNAYVEAYNFWDGSTPMSAITTAMLTKTANDLAAAQAGDYTRIKKSDIVESDRARLKIALELPGTLDSLDNSAKAIITLIDLHLPDWKQLEEYNQMRQFETDGGSKGKALLASYLTFQEKLPILYEQFQTEIEAQSKAQKMEEIEGYRTSGQTFLYQVTLSIQNAEDILNAIGADPESYVSDATRLAKGDALVKQIEERLTPIREEIDSNTDKKKFNGTHVALMNFIGKYREFKNAPTIDNYQSLLLRYNTVVGALNLANQY